ncbi:putative membrane protein [Kineococcus xinjiangensis]|uniref:Putative membrane protein n=1 Tax=Kineococcus xinjiangensis TaxID=512762 RepID=A0A2S6IF92_9ACTN|nr:DUF1622 domain-containing protein [Kineococcus xinjiangensis]PPK92879.1 putative membrane protein [Kineococcus xinjiangensis]
MNSEEAEELLHEAVGFLVTVVEACAAVVIVAGALWAFFRFLKAVATRRTAREFVSVRLTLGRFLALGLEFQLASDVLRTAVAPSFEELAKLAVVAAIRTALNYFLAKEIAEERRQIAEDDADGRPSATGGGKDRSAP